MGADASDLISRCLAGDDAAFHALFDRNGRPVRAHFLRCGFPPAVADELTQKTFARVFESLDTLPASGETVAGRAAAAARQLARKRWRRRPEPEHFDPELAAELFALPEVPDAASEEREEIDALSQCIEALPAELARIVHLRYVKARTPRGIAAEIGAPEATASARLAEAARMLEQCLKAKGILEQDPPGNRAMSDEREQPDRRLEHLLRRWGAEEAVRQAHVEHLPVPVPERAPAWRPPLRWLPLAASAVLLVGALLLMLGGPERPDSAPAGKTPPPPAASDSLRAETARLARELEAAKAALAQARRRARDRDRLADDNKTLRAELDKTKTRLEAEKRKLLDRIAHLERSVAELKSGKHPDLAKLRRAIEDKDADLAKLRSRLAAIEAGFARLKHDLAAERNLLRRQHTLVTRLRAERDAARTARHDAETRLAAVKAQQAEVRAVLQRVYLHAAAPGRSDLAARQVAARKHALLRRCSELQAKARDATTRRLLGRLEVLLTRLDLIDPANPDDVRAFLELLRKTAPLPEVERVLGTGPPAELRAWLLEIQLVLAGV